MKRRRVDKKKTKLNKKSKINQNKKKKITPAKKVKEKTIKKNFSNAFQARDNLGKCIIVMILNLRNGMLANSLRMKKLTSMRNKIGN